MTSINVELPSCLSGKESACNAGDMVRSLSKEDPLEKEMETHSSTFVWEIPWTEERSLEGYSPCCYKRVSNSLATK